LIQYATDPDEFCRAYHEFLDFYADRTYRPGQQGEPPPLIQAYQVPQPVLRAVEKEMSLFSRENRDAALAVADALWLEAYFEFRLLAAYLIGQVSPVPFSSVIQRIEAWAEPRIEEKLLVPLVNSGLARILEEHPGFYLQQIEIWLGSEQVQFIRLGLKAVPQMVESDKFEDYPTIYTQLSKMIRPLKADILAVIKVLAARSPEETAYFLGQTKRSVEDDLNISWYIRKSLANFPPDSQRYLRTVLLEEN
jgi:hypothetical protein